MWLSAEEQLANVAVAITRALAQNLLAADVVHLARGVAFECELPANAAALRNIDPAKSYFADPAVALGNALLHVTDEELIELTVARVPFDFLLIGADVLHDQPEGSPKWLVVCGVRAGLQYGTVGQLLPMEYRGLGF